MGSGRQSLTFFLGPPPGPLLYLLLDLRLDLLDLLTYLSYTTTCSETYFAPRLIHNAIDVTPPQQDMVRHFRPDQQQFFQTTTESRSNDMSKMHLHNPHSDARALTDVDVDEDPREARLRAPLSREEHHWQPEPPGSPQAMTKRQR